MTGSCGTSVMIVVPALAQREQAQPPNIAAFVPRLVRTFSDDMTDAVDGPGEMPKRQRSHDSAPQNTSPSANRVGKNRGENPRHYEQDLVVQNSEPWILSRDVRRQLAVIAALLGVLLQNPTDMGMEKSHKR